MLGDRRGWLLLVVQPLAMIFVAVIAAAFIDGTRWLIVFPPLIALMVVWIAQAVDAHQRALRVGATRGGEIAVVVLLPVALTLLTGFWLVGGRHASPSATLQDYIAAWMDNRPDAAAPLFAPPQTPEAISAEWAAQTQTLADRVAAAQARYGDASGLNAVHPFDNLRFEDPVTSGDGRVSMAVQIVREERVQTTVLGVFPTAGQQTVPVETDLTIWLVQQRQTVAWLPLAGLDSFTWKILSIDDSASST